MLIEVLVVDWEVWMEMMFFEDGIYVVLGMFVMFEV